MDFMNLTQTELAEIIGVDRTTIRNWTNKGMPYTPPEGKGQPGSYCGPLCINWWAGHRKAEHSSRKFSDVEKIALGYAIGCEAITPSAEKRFIDLMALMGVGADEASKMVYFARGALSQ